MDKATLDKVFDDFDQDKNGKIDAKELRNVIRELNGLSGTAIDESAVDAEVASILKSIDTSGDGKVDKTEFMRFFDF